MSHRRLQQQIAAKIKELRIKRGLRQKDFAKHGYNVRHYQKIESGQLNFTVKTLSKVAQALDADINDLITTGNDSSSVYKQIFHDCPFGIIVWQLVDPKNPDSICHYDHNQYGARAVYRDLTNCKGMAMLEIFPKAREQGLIDILFEVITTGQSRFIPELIRYDRNFPFTVFSTKFVKCGADLGAAIFTDITDEYLARQEVHRQKFAIENLSRLPMSENAQIKELQETVEQLKNRLAPPDGSRAVTPFIGVFD